MKDTPNNIIHYCQQLHHRGFLAACDGNISVRISENEILITPAGKPKSLISESDLAVIELSGTVLKGTPSSEVEMHLKVYNSCPKAKAVIHAHPPVSVAWSLAFPDAQELPSDCLSEVILAVGSIPIVPYARPGTPMMGENLTPYLPQIRALILARHGALCWGEDLTEAFMGMERIEHSAIILKHAMTLNPQGLTPLPPEEVTYLKNLRLKLGDNIL